MFNRKIKEIPPGDYVSDAEALPHPEEIINTRVESIDDVRNKSFTMAEAQKGCDVTP